MKFITKKKRRVKTAKSAFNYQKQSVKVCVGSDPFSGARTRKGSPCQAPSVWSKENDKARNGRCKLHGGLSTGPKTEVGKEAIRASNKRRRE